MSLAEITKDPNKSAIKLLYDISPMGCNVSSRGGIQRMTDGLLRSLSSSHNNIELLLCAFDPGLSRGAVNYAKSRPEFKKISFIHPRHTCLAWLTNNRQLRLAQIYHSTYVAIPEYLKKIKRIKCFMTVYDMIPVLYPNFCLKFRIDGFKNRMAGLDYDTWIHCISHSAKNDLCNYAKGLDCKKIFVAHLAADPALFYPCHDENKIQSVRNKYGIPAGAPYLLSLNTIQPLKNITHSLKCFAKLIAQEGIDDLYFVLAGTKGWSYEDIYRQISGNSLIKNRLIVTDYAADEDLAALYSSAMAFIFPSLYEGFGLPPLEAMQCGIPVITSNIPSLIEVVGNAGITVSPSDYDALCQGILDIYRKPSLRGILSEKSINRAKKFGWDKTAEEIISAYEKARGYS